MKCAELKEANDLIAGFYDNEKTEECERKNNNNGLSSSKFNKNNKHKLTKQQQKRTLFVGYLSGQDVDMVESYFAQFGPIDHITVNGSLSVFYLYLNQVYGGFGYVM